MPHHEQKILSVYSTLASLSGFLSKTHSEFTVWLKSWFFYVANLWRARFCKRHMMHIQASRRKSAVLQNTFFFFFPEWARKIELCHPARWSRFPLLLWNKLTAEPGRHTGRTLSHTFPRAGAITGSFAQYQFLCTCDSMSLSWDSYNPPQTSCAVTIWEHMPTHNLYPAEWANK